MSSKTQTQVSNNVYTDENFPLYEFFESNNVAYLDKWIYDIIRASYIGHKIPEKGNREIPKCFSHFTWGEYFIILATVIRILNLVVMII